MAKVFHFLPSNKNKDPQALFADALARVGYDPKVRQAVEDAYVAGYLQACREAVQMVQQINKLLQEMNALAKERLERTKEEIRMLIGNNVKLLPK